MRLSAGLSGGRLVGYANRKPNYAGRERLAEVEQLGLNCVTIGANFRSHDPAFLSVLVASGLSLAFWWLACDLGFFEEPGGSIPDGQADPDGYVPGDYRRYDEMANWLLYPFIFLGVAPAVWLTWRPFMRVWVHLSQTGVLIVESDDEPADRKSVIEAIWQHAQKWRYGVLVLSLIIAGGFNYWDIKPRVDVYDRETSSDDKLNRACEERDVFVKWLFDVRLEDVARLCKGRAASPQALAADCNHCSVVPASQWIFVSVAFAQQFLITFFSALFVLQVLLHTLLFGVFERLSVARENGARIALNCSSPIDEFGLEHWNHALNNFYWAVCPALLGVFLTRAAKPPEDLAPVQVALGVVVPIVLIAPMVATILVRQARLPEAWSSLQPNGPVDREDFHRQKLWPLDRNWAAKMGIVLAFALAALSLGYEFSQLIGV